ncbi:hypothetical protein [Nostoc sp.]
MKNKRLNVWLTDKRYDKLNLSKQNSGVRSQNNASGTRSEQHEFCTTGG